MGISVLDGNRSSELFRWLKTKMNDTSSNEEYHSKTMSAKTKDLSYFVNCNSYKFLKVSTISAGTVCWRKSKTEIYEHFQIALSVFVDFYHDIITFHHQKFIQKELTMRERHLLIRAPH